MKVMKPVMFTFLLFVLSFSLCACGRRSSNPPTTEGTISPSVEQGTTAGTVSGTEGTRENGTMENGTAHETGGGIIDGVINDVEKGVDTITGDSTRGYEDTKAPTRNGTTAETQTR